MSNNDPTGQHFHPQAQQNTALQGVSCHAAVCSSVMCATSHRPRGVGICGIV